MMKLMVYCMLISVLHTNDNINKIALVNQHKKSAEAAYKSENYEQAIQHYRYLTDSLYINEDLVLYNLGNAYLQLADTSNAREFYGKLVASNNSNIKSKSFQQLGFINQGSKKYPEALQNFKSALKADPGNEQARYNYELLKKLMQDQQDQDQDKDEGDDQDQDKNDQDDQDQEDQEGEEKENEEDKENEEGEEGEDEDKQQDGESEETKEDGEQDKPEETEEESKPEESKPQPSVNQRLEDMDMTEEKAQMILDAMRSNQIQYIQQNPRKPEKRPPSNKPDW
ncbi:MAG: hypothetical protein ACFCUU_14645 [Cyclobacteriaceae bacterium]